MLGGSNQRLIMGVFSLAPSYGVVGPGQSQTINVECVAERAGKHEEVFIPLPFCNIVQCTNSSYMYI